MTTPQITAAIRAKILESGTELLSDATVLLYANFTYQDICKRIFPNDHILTATVTFTAGVGTLPATFGTLYGDPTDSASNRFPELSIDDFNKKTLEQAVTVEGATIKVLPTTTTSLTVKYYPTFPDLTASVNPTINSYFHECIIWGTLSRCYEDMQSLEDSVFYGNKYEQELNKKIAMQSQFEEGNQRSGEFFNYQQLI
jgi:hypothetical protein